RQLSRQNRSTIPTYAANLVDELASRINTKRIARLKSKDKPLEPASPYQPNEATGRGRRKRRFVIDSDLTKSPEEQPEKELPLPNIAKGPRVHSYRAILAFVGEGARATRNLFDNRITNEHWSPEGQTIFGTRLKAPGVANLLELDSTFEENLAKI